MREIRFRDLSTSEGKVIPAPNPKLLEIHAACAQVAHLSGAAGILNEFYTELSRSPWDMSFDPSGAAVLERALRRFQVGGI